MSDEFHTFILNPEQVAKLRAPSGDGLDAGGVARFKQAITAKFNGAWELDHVRLDEGVAVLRRARVLTEVLTGVDGIVTVNPQDKTITDGRKFAAWARTHHPDLAVLSFNSVTRQGKLGAMDADVARCREAVAQVIGCDPWDIPISVTREKATKAAVRYDTVLPSFFRSKHLDGLFEIATDIVGDYRWTVEVDSQTKACALELVPDVLDREIPWVDEPVELGRGIRIGEQSDGEPWRLPVLATHKLCVAQTRWGKGSILWGYVRGLRHAIEDGSVVVWCVDLKGGVEAAMGQEFFGKIATNHADAVKMLRAARALMEARLLSMSQQRVRVHTAKPGDPALILLFDEFTALRLAAPDSKSKAAAEAELTLLLSQGGAPNVLVTAFLQSPKDKDVPARDFFPYRILGKIKNARMVNTVLGDMAKEQGADATKLPDRLKGTFYVASDGGAPPIRCRAHYSTDEEIRRDAVAVEAGARRGQATLDEILARCLPDNDDDGGVSMGSAVVDAGAWRATEPEICTACGTAVDPLSGDCIGCSR